MKMIIGSDHAGYEMKEKVGAHLRKRGVELEDVGTHSEESVDYTDPGKEVASKVSDGSFERGVLICGTGLGMSMVANRFSGVRAALCHDHYTAQMSREHNDANVLAIGARVIGEGLAEEILRTFLDTEFAGGRHGMRVAMIDDLAPQRAGSH